MAPTHIEKWKPHKYIR